MPREKDSALLVVSDENMCVEASGECDKAGVAEGRSESGGGRSRLMIIIPRFICSS